MVQKKYPTKIIPPHYEHVFFRDQLVESIEQKKSFPLIWVNGPPGSGKTVFVTSLLEKQQTNFLWYRMDSGEKNITEIFYFLTLAAQKNNPRKRLNLPVFTVEYADNIETFAGVYFRQLFSGFSPETVMVFDNCQEAERDTTFFRVLQIAINELQQGMRIFCISRNRPASILSRLRINHELLEIGAAELRFNEKESPAFLKWINPQLDEQYIQYIQLKTQGWAAGMVLMAEQYDEQSKQDFADNLEENEHVFAYLGAEILSRLQNELREFLIKSAFFIQFTSEMGQELTGERQAKQFLDSLVNKNFLIERTVGSKPLYSYHPLFRDLLLDLGKKQLDEKEWLELQEKTAAILVNENRADEAMPLYFQLQDWSALRTLLLDHSDTLIKTGRHRSVIKWMEALPDIKLEKDTWLSYWYAVALKPVNPVLAIDRLDKNFDQFMANKDIIGMYSAWQAAVESIFFSMDDYSSMNVWMRRFDEMRKHYPACPSFELKARFYATAVQALTNYKAQHPLLKSLVKISERMFRIIPIKMLRLMICTQLGHYYALSGQMTKFQVVVPCFKPALYDDSLPALPRIMIAFLLGIQSEYHGKGTEALGFLQKGSEITEESGIHLLKGVLNGHIACSHICNGDLVTARNSLQTMIDSANSNQCMLTALSHSISAWIYALQGELTYAFEQNQQALTLTRQCNSEVGYVCSLALKAQLLAEMQQLQKAEQVFSLLSDAVENTENNLYRIQYFLTDAWLGYLSDDQSRTLFSIRQFLILARSEQILFFFGWRPDVLSPLFIMAIENGIEEAHVKRMLKLNTLFSAPPLYLEKWPWPVHIYSFGQENVKIDGKFLEYSSKSPTKILDLLTAIIAFGGRNVSSEQLGQVLWPDSDGDIVQQTLETALHRLRKLIGKQAVIVNAGRISLNDKICWLDLWSFEETTDSLDLALIEEADCRRVIKLTDRMLDFYRGPFLNQSNCGWVKPKQEQLQNKLFRLIDRSANYHEKRQETDRVNLLLEKKIEVTLTGCDLLEAYAIPHKS